MWKNIFYSLKAWLFGLEFKYHSTKGYILNNKHLERINLYYGKNNNLIIETSILDTQWNLTQIQYQNGEVWQYRNLVTPFNTNIIINNFNGLLHIKVAEEIISFNNNKIFFKVK
jgi:hypothetical protein